jgi:hypothetical protein
VIGIDSEASDEVAIVRKERKQPKGRGIDLRSEIKVTGGIKRYIYTYRILEQ